MFQKNDVILCCDIISDLNEPIFDMDSVTMG